MKTTPQKIWGRENERKKSYYVLPVVLLTKQTQGTDIHGGIVFWWFVWGWLGSFPQYKRFNKVPKF